MAALLFAWLAGTPLPAQDAAAGKPFLHPLFTDHMVLQRNVTTTIAWMSRGTASGTRRDCPRAVRRPDRAVAIAAAALGTTQQPCVLYHFVRAAAVFRMHGGEGR